MLDQNTDRMWYVIGAVLIGAAIIFGMNTLMPEAFASVGELFMDLSDDVSMNIQINTSRDTQVLHTMDLSEGINSSVYRARDYTLIDVNDSELSPAGSIPLDIHFTEGHDGKRTSSHDLVVWISPSHTNAVRKGDILEVSYYAKSSNSSNAVLGSRYGGVFHSEFMRSELSDEWAFYRYLIPVVTPNGYSNQRSAFVLWSEDPSEVSLADLNIQIYTSDEDGD